MQFGRRQNRGAAAVRDKYQRWEGATIGEEGDFQIQNMSSQWRTDSDTDGTDFISGILCEGIETRRWDVKHSVEEAVGGDGPQLIRKGEPWELVH